MISAILTLGVLLSGVPCNLDALLDRKVALMREVMRSGNEDTKRDYVRARRVMLAPEKYCRQKGRPL